jgi:hypothetical protein
MLLDYPSKIGLREQLVADRPIGHGRLDLLNERSRRWVLGGTKGQFSKVTLLTGNLLWLVREIHARSSYDKPPYIRISAPDRSHLVRSRHDTDIPASLRLL